MHSDSTLSFRESARRRGQDNLLQRLSLENGCPMELAKGDSRRRIIPCPRFQGTIEKQTGDTNE